MNDDQMQMLKHLKQFPAKFETTGTASLVVSQQGASTGISLIFTLPSGYTVPDRTCYLVMVPDGFSMGSGSDMDYLLLVVGQSCGTWTGAETMREPGSGGCWGAWNTNVNSLDSANKEFNLNLGMITNPSVTGKTDDIKIWINFGKASEDVCLVTCPGVEITS